MKKKKNKKDVEIDEVLNLLWNLRNNEQFYFKAYGKEALEELVKSSDVFQINCEIDLKQVKELINENNFLKERVKTLTAKP